MAILPLAIAGAVIGGVFGFGKARSRNKAIRQAALLNQARINKFMVQTRMDSAIQTEQLSRAAQKALGAVMNTSPERQGSLEALALDIGGVFSDQFAIDTERDRRLEALGAEKQNIATEATNASQNETLAALTGALSGFQVGGQTGGTIDQAISSRRLSQFSSEIGGLQLREQRANTGLAEFQFNNRDRIMGNAQEDVDRGNSSVGAIGAVVTRN